MQIFDDRFQAESRWNILTLLGECLEIWEPQPPGTPSPFPGLEWDCFTFYMHVTDQSYYRVADKSLARPTSRCILFDVENISFDATLVVYINSTNIPPIMIINRIYEHQNLLSL